MINHYWTEAAIVAALLLLGVWGWRRATAPGHRPSTDYWGVLGLAALVAAAHWSAIMTGPITGGLSQAISLTVAAGTLLFALAAATLRDAWRLAPLVAGYMVLAVGLAVLARPFDDAEPVSLASPWALVHIATSVLTYGLITLAAITGVAVAAKQRSLKSKRPGLITARLPAARDGEMIQRHMLMASATLLVLGVVTGIGALHAETGALLAFDHKTVLSLAALVVVIGLLWALGRGGVRGRLVSQAILVIYLLVTLAYPGVKVVTQIL